ncbi:hypothetical protein SNEBB_000652 [Seison nebaliae]|nr:hypothetical protein SNEBB_000652 [Seison nebaliae]
MPSNKSVSVTLLSNSHEPIDHYVNEVEIERTYDRAPPTIVEQTTTTPPTTTTTIEESIEVPAYSMMDEGQQQQRQPQQNSLNDESSYNAEQEQQQLAAPSDEQQQSLPSYEEALKYKKAYESLVGDKVAINVPYTGASYPNNTTTTTAEDHTREARRFPFFFNSSTMEERNIGTDCMFLITFVTSFVLNWFGFLLCICLVPTAAGRYGALAGLGLSLIKWGVFIRSKYWNYERGDMLDRALWWLLMLVGIFFFIQAITRYFFVRTLSRIRHNRTTNGENTDTERQPPCNSPFQILQ